MCCCGRGEARRVGKVVLMATRVVLGGQKEVENNRHRFWAVIVFQLQEAK